MLPADMFTAIRGGLVGERKLLDRSYVGQLTNSKVRTMRASQILDKIDEDQELGKSNVRPVTGELPSSMLLVNSSEYKEGEAAFYRGLTIRNNPYPFLSPEYWRWQEGFFGNGRPRERQVNPGPYKLGQRYGGEARLGKPR
jgi:hypothetical protein